MMADTRKYPVKGPPDQATTEIDQSSRLILFLQTTSEFNEAFIFPTSKAQGWPHQGQTVYQPITRRVCRDIAGCGGVLVLLCPAPRGCTVLVPARQIEITIYKAQRKSESDKERVAGEEERYECGMRTHSRQHPWLYEAQWTWWTPSAAMPRVRGLVTPPPLA
ncbi:hypothetical protein CBL_07668 [Carabus blaptoides fortunei]